ncbi:hypothetical protein GF380_04075 [Candidatus Uhrbacteria bacterium]|nr:hypothetical protein [Candidatus Uhrbacteria bacterium]MBD3284261.1 hypothetical protein [Candidatus Uhrbacteria bacterium]
MQTQRRTALVAVLLVLAGCCYLLAGSVLPRTTAVLFASPDETAVHLFAQSWVPGQGLQIGHQLQDELSSLNVLHPRSMVRQGSVLVPVGFLGMPMLIWIFERLATGAGSFFTVLLVLSAAYPLFRLTSRQRSRIGWMSVALFLTFPTVLLYVNRGLFPNLPIVALTIWSVWLLRGIREERRTIVTHYIVPMITGLLIGTAILIRPVELLWMFPWFVWGLLAGVKSPIRKWIWTKRFRILIVCVTTIFVCLFGLYTAIKTYPTFSTPFQMPVIGYQLHDDTLTEVPTLMSVETQASATFSDYLPFGFHPRVLWSNMRVYLFGYLGVWIAVAALGLIVLLRRRFRFKQEGIVLLIGGWMIAVLLMFYGQAQYTDNIRGTVSLGNSFLRYLLPLTPIIAYLIAQFVDRVWQMKHRGVLTAMILLAFFLIYGPLTAFLGDEEGIVQTQHQLRRYTAIRAQVDKLVPNGSVILSERSDKIFASGPYAVSSRLPDANEMLELAFVPRDVYLFHRELTEEEELYTKIYLTLGAPRLLFQVDNERFYLLQAKEQVRIPNP